ncbi:MAG: ArsA-related P-loop ATPase [Acidimicrobiales bacterium]
MGKGGAGRSTVAAALALRAASAGGRILAVDATAAGGLASALSWGRPVTPGVITAGGPGHPSLLALSTEAALEQYLRMNLKLAAGARVVGPLARILDFVATAAPAVREILAIGKIGHEVRTGAWDQVIVDGPATGHVVELLSAPDALRPLVGRGPLHDDTVWLSALLADPAITRAVAVSLGEELVVSETAELMARLDAETRVMVSGLVANRLPPPIGPVGEAEAGRLAAAGDPLAPVATLAVARHRSWRAQQERLAALGLPMVEVPDQPAHPVAAVADALAAARW